MRTMMIAGVVALAGLTGCAAGELNARVPEACTGVGQTSAGECPRSVAPAKGLGMGHVQQRSAAVDRSLGR